MSAARKGLGRGFESLIPLDTLETLDTLNTSFDPTREQDSQVTQLRDLPLTQITADPEQPRRHFDEAALAELAQSVKEHGVVQPIIVAQSDVGFVIVAGERRFRAAQLAGLPTIPALVRSLSDQHKLEISLIENIQRRDLNAIETATAYLKLRDQFNLSLEDIGNRVHKSAGTVTNTMRLLRLPKEVQAAIVDGRLSEGQVRPLVGQPDDLILEVFPRIITEGWSARKVEQYLANLKALFARRGPDAKADEAPDVAHEQRVSTIRERLQSDVDIKVNSRGAGRIVIKFKTAADLERIEKFFE